MSSAGDDDPIRLERRGRIALLTIDREPRRNALSRATLLGFGRIGRELANDGSVGAVVVTGAGDKAFSAGADLKERAGMSLDEVRAQLALYRSELDWLDGFRAPVVAALNGDAFGGGLELALLCDLRIAAAHARLGLTETTLGIVPGAGGTQRLPRIVGEARAKEMILFGLRLDAARALEWGLVNRVVPAGSSLLDETLAWIEPLAEGAPIALAAALRAIDAAGRASLEQGLAAERACYEECLASEDRVEALAAFAQKRKPRFRGR